jgi:hypothetical protein
MCVTELDRYKSKSPEIPEENPLHWWSRNKNLFPILYKLALRLLAIQATSAATERLWSLAANIITKNRTQLHGHVVADLIMLKENGHIMRKHAVAIEGRERFLPTIYDSQL